MDQEKTPSIVPEDLKLTHDGYFRETFQMKRLAKAFLKKVLPKQTVRCLDLNGLAIETRYLGDEMFKDTSADVIYRVPIKGTSEFVNFFVIVEHKSYHDFQTIFQLWGYVYRICRREFLAAMERNEEKTSFQFPPVVAIIVHHGESRFQGKTELSELFLPLPGLDDYLAKLQAILFDLNTIADDDPVLNDPEVPELKVVLTVLKTVFRRDVATKVRDVLRELKSLSDDPATQRLLRATFVYLANNAKHLRRNADALVGTFQETVGEKIMSTLVEMWEARGEARGKAEGKVEAVLTVLRTRFGQVPEELETVIRKIADPTALESWVVHATTCKTLEEFEKAVR